MKNWYIQVVIENAKFGRGWIVLTKGNIDYVDFGLQNKKLSEDELKGEIIRVDDKYYECLTNANQSVRYKTVKVIDIETKKQEDLIFRINYFTGLRKIIRKV